LETERGEVVYASRHGRGSVALMTTRRCVGTCAIHVVWGAPVSFVGGAYTEGRLLATHCRKGVPDRGERLYPGDDGAGARSNGRGDDVDGGENIGVARKLLPVTWNPI
jgi:hypothetical protein